jgi:pimeloyl-ACP methyl ester carboxylesterase
MARGSRFRSEVGRDAYVRLYDAAVAAAPMRVHELDVETSYGVTHVLAAGPEDGPPLVALHAKSFSSTMWLPLLPVLAEGHRAYLIDAVGDLNKSVATRPLSSPGHVSSWLKETTAALGVSRSVVVGGSIGAWMGTHFAMDHPERVERLVLVAPVGIVSSQHPRWLASAMLTCAVMPRPDRLQAFVLSMAAPEGRSRLDEEPWRTVVEQFTTGLPTFRSKLNEARPTRCDIARLAAGSQPTLVLIGEEESLHDGRLMAGRFRGHLPSARVELIPGAGHLLWSDQPIRVASLLEEFLSQDEHDHT